MKNFDLRKTIHIATIVVAMLGTSCSTDDQDAQIIEEEMGNEWEEEVAALTAAMQNYRDFDTAVAEGYDTDASGYVPQMGHHYVKESLVDSRFELLKPEILLFVPNGDTMELVGVEYMVPFTDPENPQPAPSGFKGSADVWAQNEQLSAWTLHVWIFKENPAGIFKSLNSTLP